MPLYKGSTLVKGLYKGTTPVLRLFKGTVEVWRRNPADTPLITPGSSTFVAPSFAAWLDVGVVGGGASGSTGDNGVSTARGTGAPPAVWATATVAVKPGDVFSYTVGQGGAAKNGVKVNGENGTASIVTRAGVTIVQSSGSTGPTANTANNDPTGRGTAASSVNGLTLPGAADVGEGTAGNPPGSGGGGGPNIPWINNGSGIWSGAGARGEIRYRFRSY